MKRIIKKLVTLFTVLTVTLSVAVNAAAQAQPDITSECESDVLVSEEESAEPLANSDKIVKTSSLTISGTTATCMGEYTDNERMVVHIDISVTLQKFAYLWFWDDMAKRSSSLDGRSNVVKYYIYNLDSGIYRVKTDIRLRLTNGAEENYTLYSPERTVA